MFSSAQRPSRKMAIRAVSVMARLGGLGASVPEQPGQVPLDRRPLAADDAVVAGVPQGPVGQDEVVAPDAVQLGPETLDRAPAGRIEEGGPEADRDAVGLLERLG